MGTPFGPPIGEAQTLSTVTTLGMKWHEVDGAAKYRLAYRPASSTGSFTNIDVSGPSATIKRSQARHPVHSTSGIGAAPTAKLSTTASWWATDLGHWFLRAGRP